MDGIITSQAASFGKISRPASKLFIKLDKIELHEQVLQLTHRFGKLTDSQPSNAVRLGKSCPSLRIDKSGTGYSVRAVPEQGGTRRTRLGYKQRH
ncbi:hypothetical protein BH23ACT12_BH23ACT12_15500 [soil metagenome]